ncbi:hypothetical protein JHK85_006678 [Glycine max]|nr:hypothetical protein JHK85_006678 [Glycine max]
MMKALTSSCSKAMVETLGPFSPRVPLCVSDRPKFCFTLRSKNEKKGWNLLLLKLVRNNDLYPVHAVPPKDQDLISSISHKSNKKSILRPSEESADSPGNDDIIHDLGHNGNAASLENQEKTIVESSLFDLEEGPVLVPGLTIPPTEPTDEADQGEVQESTKKDISVEAFETQDQNIAEFSKEEETDDAIPQEINATINNEPELLYNKHEESHLSPEMEDRPNYEPDDDNPLQNDIKWSQDTVNKFLTKLGFF